MIVRLLPLTMIVLIFGCAGPFGHGSAKKAGAVPQPKAVEVFFLTGQSNMEGVGSVSQLTPAQKDISSDVRLWNNNSKGWEPVIYRTDYFGVEVALAHALKKAMPGAKIVFIKHAAGGTNLHEQWRPLPEPGPLYAGFVRKVQMVLDKMSQNNENYEIAGIFWMQGESDAGREDFAIHYESNLKDLIAEMRKKFGKPDTPFIFGRISTSLKKETPWDFPEVDKVRQAMKKVSDDVPNVFMINTDDLPTLEDNTHFDTAGILELGNRFAKAYLDTL
jgi:hypothetical protein